MTPIAVCARQWKLAQCALCGTGWCIYGADALPPPLRFRAATPRAMPARTVAESPAGDDFWKLAKSQRLFLEEVARAICKADGRDPERTTHPRSSGPVISDSAIPEWRNFIPHAIAAAKAIGND